MPKAEQLQAIHAVVTGNDGFVKPATGFGKDRLKAVAKWLRFYVELPVETAMIFISEKLKDDCMTEKLSIVHGKVRSVKSYPKLNHNLDYLFLYIPVCVDNAIMKQ